MAIGRCDVSSRKGGRPVVGSISSTPTLTSFLFRQQRESIDDPPVQGEE
jgi:hypothetical protein